MEKDKKDKVSPEKVGVLWGADVAADQVIFGSIFKTTPTKGERKKMEIVAAAAKLFGEKGIDATGYDDLSKALNTTRSHINYHFKDRDDLLVAVIKYMMAQGHEYTFQRLGGTIESKKLISSYLDGYYDFFVHHAHYRPVIVYFYYEATRPGILHDLQSSIRMQGQQRIQELLRQVLLSQNKRIPKDLDAIAYQCQVMMVGGLIVSLSTGQEVTEEKMSEAKKQILSAISRIINVDLD